MVLSRVTDFLLRAVAFCLSDYQTLVSRQLKTMIDRLFTRIYWFYDRDRIGGFVKNGKWFIGDGHHRVAAAIKYGMNTGDYGILTQMMNYGSFSTPPFTPTHIIFPKKWR